MTLDEAIKHCEEVVEEQEKLFRVCPASESDLFNCDGTKDCRTLKNGKDMGCLKCAEEHRQLAEWLKELKQLREQTRWIPVSERMPEKNVEVLATTEWGAVTIAEMYSANDCFIHEGATNAETDEIVAWMPLPEPYKKESEEV